MTALGKITTGSFVRSVRAIEFAIAYAAHIHAAIRHVRTTPLLGFAFEHGRTACVQFGVLVGTIPAVVLTIANIRLEHASLVLASKESSLAVDLSARLRFVGLVRTIRSTVTVPTPRYTDCRTDTTELLIDVALIRC